VPSIWSNTLPARDTAVRDPVASNRQPLNTHEIIGRHYSWLLVAGGSFGVARPRCLLDAPAPSIPAQGQQRKSEAILEDALALSGGELEQLISIYDASLKIRKRHQFFLWVQGVVQSLFPHDVLICALGDYSKANFQFDCFSVIPVGDTRLTEMCHPDRGFVQRVVRIWEASGHKPVLIDPRSQYDGYDPKLYACIDHFQLEDVAAHGTFHLNGATCTFFSFSRTARPLSGRHAYLLELIIPFLHSAYMRIHMDAYPVEHTIPFSNRLLTNRQAEILLWVQQGKSNAEIGDILSISSLTVKNHVQKILRRLNVQNRAQAAAKGLSLNIVKALSRN
jgi:transcriptional regulator EpsA